MIIYCPLLGLCACSPRGSESQPVGLSSQCLRTGMVSLWPARGPGLWNDLHSSFRSAGFKPSTVRLPGTKSGPSSSLVF